jgi:hypothetical protein
MAVELGKRVAQKGEREANVRIHFAKPFGIFEGADAGLRLNKEYVHSLHYSFWNAVETEAFYRASAQVDDRH